MMLVGNHIQLHAASLSWHRERHSSSVDEQAFTYKLVKREKETKKKPLTKFTLSSSHVVALLLWSQW
jgi:hypothetical protein